MAHSTPGPCLPVPTVVLLSGMYRRSIGRYRQEEGIPGIELSATDPGSKTLGHEESTLYDSPDADNLV